MTNPTTRITLLGSGTAVPLPHRGSPGTVLRQESSDRTLQVLVDLGSGTLQRMVRADCPLEDLTHVLITHFHPDHVGDLVPLLFALRNPRLERSAERPPLEIHGPPGLASLVEGLARAHGRWVEPPEHVRICEAPEVEGDVFRVEGRLVVRAFSVEHTPVSRAYRFELPGGKVFVVSGDTDLCDGIIEAARDADLLFLECAFPEGEKRSGHLTPREAGKVAGAANVRKCVLTHLYPECEGKDLITPCREFYSSSLLVGEDGRTFRL